LVKLPLAAVPVPRGGPLSDANRDPSEGNR
jgi:hypothetical protein